MPKNIMVDLETLGTVPGCAILSIGAVEFGPDGVGEQAFYKVLNKASCMEVFLSVSRATEEWWKQQGPEAREVLDHANDPQKSVPIVNGLQMFNDYLRGFGEDVLLWGNGADFDNAILQVAYSVCSVTPAWKFYNNRCYRTLKNLHPDITLARTGTYHNALDDARCQAEHAVQLLKRQDDCANLWGEYQDDSAGEEGRAALLGAGTSGLGGGQREADTPRERLPRQNVPTGLR